MNRSLGLQLVLGLCILAGVTWFLVTPKMTSAQTARFLASPYYGIVGVNGGYSADHPAIDYDMHYQQVLADASGNVTRVAWYNDSQECHQNANVSACGYGLHMYITHSNGYVSRYGHLSATAFPLGTTSWSVNGGVVIGTSGHTGWSTGPHLHFEVRNASNIAVDPASLWKDGASFGHPLPAPANSGEFVADDTPDNTGGFQKGRGGLFQVYCPPEDCLFWNRETTVGYAGDMYHTMVSGTWPDYWAAWTPAIPAEANYEVFVYVPINYATSWQAPYTVQHADGAVTGVVDQYGLYDQWVSIGIYRMVPGSWVFTIDNTGESVSFHCGQGQWCNLGVDAIKFVRRDTLYQPHWRGGQLWTRNVPIINGAPQWSSASAWVGPGSVSYLPGSDTLQTENFFMAGSTLWHQIWRGNQGWYRSLPTTRGQIDWSSSGWSGPIPIGGLPGSGDMQTQTDFVVGSTLWQPFWRGNQGWYRTVPIVNSQPQWGSASGWTGPMPITALPGSGDIQTQADYTVGGTLWQSFWRGNQGFYRTVPIINGVPQWGSASAWSGPQPLTIWPGSGDIQAQSGFTIP